LGVSNQPFLATHQWQAQVSYQYGHAYQLFVGDQRNDAAGPFGQPPQRRVSLFNLDVTYGLSNRLSLDLTVPYVVGSGGSLQGPDKQHATFYQYNASGFGDLTLQGEYWLSDPLGSSRVNGSVGLGINAPTGSDNVTGTFYSKDGPVTLPIDEAFQLGNGGWTLLLRAQGTAQMVGPLFAYASGYYGMSLTEHTNVIQGGALRGVPDTYSGRLGVAYVLPILQGLVLSAGGQINGVPVRDVIGGGDLYWRRPGYEVYVAPGLTWTLGANMANLTIPVRVYQDKLDSLLDVSKNRHVGANFVPYFIQATVARRF